MRQGTNSPSLLPPVSQIGNEPPKTRSDVGQNNDSRHIRTYGLNLQYPAPDSAFLS